MKSLLTTGQSLKKYAVVLLSVIALFSHAAQTQEKTHVIKLDPAMDNIVSPDAKVERLADGFQNLEGPVWVRKGGYLLFSDIPKNVINRWNPVDGKVSLFLERSGYTGPGLVQFEGGSNGITLDKQGRVVFAAKGDRQIVRLEKDGKRTVLASECDGKRLNPLNDLVFRSDGSIYFTDGRPRDPAGAPYIPYRGVYLLKDGKVKLLTKDLPGNNGLAFAPGEKQLYIVDDPLPKMVVMRYDVQKDGTIANGQVYFDLGLDKGDGHADGIKVDQKGNVYVTGPGGVWVISPERKHIGTILAGDLTNLAFGGEDGKTLYMTGRKPLAALYRIHLKVAGITP